ncbi:hypothetical protein MCUN1_000078 [Malassezia cuniculi]|uniref:sphingolipid 4-desaturase n=1 Tax=Malassezia cuniculi TaxID=948313 RepID=A0AAF0ENB9_9BASI|nr:hypothetical protein MCUN1_000078 [Malassezia cuniculi]
MLSFCAWARSDRRVAPSVKVDWSFYGGAETVCPSDEARRRAAASKEPVDGRPWLPHISDKPQPQDDFLWLMTEEPHRTRRMAILHAHPEVRQLMGHDPITKYVACGVVALQLSIAIAFGLNGYTAFDWRLLLTAYLVGAIANQNLFLAVHEITHNLAFKGIAANRVLAIIANFPIGIPFAMTFKPYHIEHHKHLGEDGIDTDLPTNFELWCLGNVFGKTFFATFQLLFYALRPGFVRVQRLTLWHAANIISQLAVDYALVRFCNSWTPLSYMLFSSFFAGSLHPIAGHFIAEHYMFSSIQQETWSYYGPLNILTYNVGYHNEHHDFPSISWRRLPKLHEMAPEFYKPLPCHHSWTLVIVQFLLDRNAGLFARVKRKARMGKHSVDPTPEDARNHTGWELRPEAEQTAPVE